MVRQPRCAAMGYGVLQSLPGPEGLVNKASFVVQTDAGQLRFAAMIATKNLVEAQAGKVAVSDKPINIHV
ncbi:MAG: hypothetical protein H6799_03715 [Candidatus Nomurabacteria bacterium]|nr:MAG: hypothetical protein H6799_03715 [Candidatus Nomurabacteria bacterium]